MSCFDRCSPVLWWLSRHIGPPGLTTFPLVWGYPFIMSRFLVGTSSWTEKTLVESGRFYPPDIRTADAQLRFCAIQFPVV